MTQLVYMVILDFIESNQEQFAEFCGDDSIAWANHNEFKEWLEERDKSDAKILYELKANNERLEKEADWLAYMLANGDDCVRDACNDSSPCKMPDHELPYKEEYVQKYCKPCWRNAARKAIDDADNAMEAEQEARER